MTWCKKRALEKLDFAVANGKADAGMIPLLDIINSFEGVFTTSSCSGRINIIMLQGIGQKKTSEIILKSHEPLNDDGIINSLKKFLADECNPEKEDLPLEHNTDTMILLNIEPPIIHYSSENLETGLKIMQAAKEAGFKNSSIKHISDKGGRFEILSTETFHMPLIINGISAIMPQSFNALEDLTKTTINRGKEKIKALEEKLFLMNEK